MKSKLNYFAVAVTLPVVLGTVGNYDNRANAAEGIDVSCALDATAPTVVATLSNPRSSGESTDKVSQQTEILSFLPEYFSPSEASQKCQATATSLQGYYSQNIMNYLASDTIDGKPVVCAVERRGVSCDGYNSEVLFSLEKAVNPNQLLYDMLGQDFKSSQLPASRTLSRTYSDLRPRWWPF